MRFASKDDYELEQYFEGYDFSIEPIYNLKQGTTKMIDLQKPSSNSVQGAEAKSSLHVLTEALSVNLSNNAIGYFFHVDLKTKVFQEMQKNGRIANSYASYHQHYSDDPVEGGDNWPEQLRIVLQNENGGGIRSLQVAVDQRWRWWSGWEAFSGWQTIYSNFNSPETWIAPVDGPWKLRANIHYTPLFCGACVGGFGARGYSVSWVQL
jgi:hypothetical protein